MPIIVAATFENGVLRPHQPVALREGDEVQISILTASDYREDDPLAGVIGIGASGIPDGADRHDDYLYGSLRPEGERP